jgi:hypothetical protein
VIAEINRRHDLLRENLMRQLREAPSRDRAKEVEKRIEESNMERGKELREAGKLRWEGFVDWGPEEEGWRSECESWGPGERRERHLMREKGKGNEG